MPQLVTRVSEDLVDEIDRLVASDRYRSRSDVVKAALAELIDAERRKEVGRRIAEGYARVPETDDERRMAESMSRAAIADEPW
ncbi:MAG: ribbon-helix-helix domain-containing protein [Actinomycetota bacterium]